MISRLTTNLFFSLALILTSVTAEPLAQPVVVQVPSEQNQARVPADRKAFIEASSHKDIPKKIEAFEKFVKDYPQSMYVVTAHRQILDLLLLNFPTQKDRIFKAINSFLLAVPSNSKDYFQNQIANTLLETGLYLEKAEELANKALTRIEEDLSKNANLVKAPYHLALGRIYLKQNRLKEAEKNLRLAYNGNPMLAGAALALAELSDKKGDFKSASEFYLTALALGGRLPDGTRQKAEELYRKNNKGSLTGFDEAIDEKYLKLNEPLFKVSPYVPDAKRSNRIVLAEVFTGASCGPCVAADLAFDLMMERYKLEELVVLMYHLHIPGPDPMTNPSTIRRGQFYGVRGVPSYAIDGLLLPPGGGSRSNTKAIYDRLIPTVEKRLQSPAEAEIKMTVSSKGEVINVVAQVSNIIDSASNLRLQIALVEENQRYSGENGIRFHPMVVRSLGGPVHAGFVVSNDGIVEWAFDVSAITAELKDHLDDYEQNPARGEPFTFREKKHAINRNQLMVVAYLQDEKTKAILQTAQVKVKAEMASK